ncbi:MAG TPA: ABC transporter substrate-binding protein [Acidimicrobiales bacterium]
MPLILPRSVRRALVTPVALLLTITVVAAACGSSKSTTQATIAPASGADTSHLPTDGTPKDGGSLAWGLEGESDSLNPVTGRWALSGHMVGSAIFDSLAALDADGKVQPVLAKSFDANADTTVWTINLKDGITFQNGEPFDGAAVTKALNTYKTALITGAAFKVVDTVTQSGPMAVTVTLKQPMANFANIFVGQGGYMPAPAMLDNPFGGDHPIGTGPFTFQEWVKNDHVTVVKNTKYWQAGLPHLDQITFKPIESAQDRLAALLDGTVNAIDTVTPDSIRTIRENANLRYLEYGVGEEIHVPLNTLAPPFDNLAARQAVAYATNQPDYIAQIGAGVYTPANGMFAPGQLGYTEDSGYPTFDLDKAKQLVAQYTQETGKPLAFTLLAQQDVEYAKSDQLLKTMWEAAGMQVTLQSKPQADQIIAVVLGQYQAADFRLFGQPDPDAEYYWWSSGTVAPPGGVGLNMARFANAETDKALNEGRASNDQATRDQAYQTFEKAWNANVPDIFLARADWLIASTPNVHGYAAGASGTSQTLGPKTWIADLWIG